MKFYSRFGLLNMAPLAFEQLLRWGDWGLRRESLALYQSWQLESHGILERFSSKGHKTNTKVITSTKQRNEPIQIRNLLNALNAREKSRVQVEISFGFPSHWLINLREIFKPITKRSNCNGAILLSTVI